MAILWGFYTGLQCFYGGCKGCMASSRVCVQVVQGRVVYGLVSLAMGVLRLQISFLVASFAFQTGLS